MLQRSLNSFQSYIQYINIFVFKSKYLFLSLINHDTFYIFLFYKPFFTSPAHNFFVRLLKYYHIVLCFCCEYKYMSIFMFRS